MTREIKFRAWDKLNKEMVFLDYIWNDHWYDKDGKATIDNCNSVMREKIYNKQLILMQFTGLKDKNGKDIYEGDIVQGNVGDDADFGKVEVYWRSGGFGVKNKFTEVDPDSITFVDLESCEVIGNIYENPNLLT